MAELFTKTNDGQRVVSLHDIAGRLCVQRGPRGIRQSVTSAEELIGIGGELELTDEDLTEVVKEYFGPARAAQPALDSGYTDHLDAHFGALAADLREVKGLMEKAVNPFR